MATRRARDLERDDDGQLEDAASRLNGGHRRGAPRLFIQIGPKIRVGGAVGHFGQAVKEGVGKAAKVAAPVVSFINPAIGAALAAGGKVLDTTDGGTSLSDLPKLALTAGATAAGGKLLGSALSHVPGVSTVTGAISDRAKALLEHVPDGLKGIVSGGGADGKGNLGTLGDMAGSLMGDGAGGTGGGGGGGGTGMSLADKLLLGGTVAAGAADEVQKHNLQNKATDYATGAYDAKAPLRAKALALLANPPGPDPRLAAISADPGNVYDRARRARMLAATAAQPGVA